MKAGLFILLLYIHEIPDLKMITQKIVSFHLNYIIQVKCYKSNMKPNFLDLVFFFIAGVIEG